jgi:hypothetical protein
VIVAADTLSALPRRRKGRKCFICAISRV